MSVLLTYEREDGLKLFIDPAAIESIQEGVSERSRHSLGGEPLAHITTLSGRDHLVRDPERQVGQRWLAAVARLMEARADG